MAVEAFVAPAPVAVVAVTGADRLSYLDAVTSQRLGDAEPGRVLGALELDVHGAPLAVMDAVVLAQRVLLLLPGELGDVVADRLGRRTFLADARFERVDVAMWSLRGSGAGAVATRAGLEVLAGAVVERDGVVVVGRDGGLDLVGTPDDVAPVVARLRAAGAGDGDADDLEAWRVAAGVPRWGSEIAPPHLPEELGLLPTHVHLAKGCYPGQEAVARMWMLGRPRRRLALVTASAGIDAGWEAGAGKRRVVVTSTATDGRALAFVPADAAPGVRFDGDDGHVEVTRLVGDDLPVPGSDPAVTRRRDRRAG